jgi:hypothetical protein
MKESMNGNDLLGTADNVQSGAEGKFGGKFEVFFAVKLCCFNLIRFRLLFHTTILHQRLTLRKESLAKSRKTDNMLLVSFHSLNYLKCIYANVLAWQP